MLVLVSVMMRNLLAAGLENALSDNSEHKLFSCDIAPGVRGKLTSLLLIKVHGD